MSSNGSNHQRKFEEIEQRIQDYERKSCEAECILRCGVYEPVCYQSLCDQVKMKYKLICKLSKFNDELYEARCVLRSGAYPWGNYGWLKIQRDQAKKSIPKLFKKLDKLF